MNTGAHARVNENIRSRGIDTWRLPPMFTREADSQRQGTPCWSLQGLSTTLQSLQPGHHRVPEVVTRLERLEKMAGMVQRMARLLRERVDAKESKDIDNDPAWVIARPCSPEKPVGSRATAPRSRWRRRRNLSAF
jgi:hypothetical protein